MRSLSVTQVYTDFRKVALGDPSQPPSTPYPSGGADSKYYLAETVLAQLAALKERSIRRVLRSDRSTFGVGSGNRLLPECVDSVRVVLCFVRPREEDNLFLLVQEYSLYANDENGVAKVRRGPTESGCDRLNLAESG